MTEEQQEESTPKNTVTIEDAGPCKKKISIEVPEEAIQAATDEQYETLRRDMVVPGFRKGRAPRRLLEKRFGKETAEQVKLKLLAEASDTAMKDNEIDALREPDVDYEKIELPESGPLKFDFEVEVRPEFDLPSLEAIPVKKTMLEVTGEQVDAEIEQLQKWSGLWAPKEGGKVELDDQIVADVSLKAEDSEEEEKLNNIDIFARKGGFVGAVPVEDLDELLVGAASGETKETTVNVPKTYFREEYRGKKVDVKITVKDIKYLKPAELSEELFKRLGVEDEPELREKVRDSLQGRLEQQVRSDMTEQIYRYMLDNTKLDLPTDVVADQATTVLQRQYSSLLQKGLPREQIDEQMEQLRAGSEEQAREQLKGFFVMDKVADKLEIEVTEEEVNGHVAQLAIQRGMRPEKMREQMLRDGSLGQFRLQVRENKCVAKLLETAQITEVKPKKEAKKAQKAVKKAKKAVKKSEKTVKKSEKTVKKPQKTAKKAVKKASTPKKKTASKKKTGK